MEKEKNVKKRNLILFVIVNYVNMKKIISKIKRRNFWMNI